MNCRERPYANVCLTNECNYKCYYCQVGGENHGIYGKKSLQLNDVKKILKILDNLDVKRIRFTGGEPTLLPYFGDIICYALELGFSKIRISTNGHNVSRYVEKLKNERIRIQVSLDTLEKEKFAKITGGGNLEQVMKELDILSTNNINTRINVVVMKSNLMEINNIINYCNEKNFSIKLLGLELLDCFDKERVLREIISKKEYSELLENIGDKCNEIMAPGKLGIPMSEYKAGKTNIRIRFFDGWGAKYIEFCKNCSIFPCPSGIYGIQILSNGETSLCRFRRGKKIDLLECKDEKDIALDLENLLDEVIDDAKKIKQTEVVTFGTKEFIKTPESIHNDRM